MREPRAKAPVQVPGEQSAEPARPFETGEPGEAFGPLSAPGTGRVLHAEVTDAPIRAEALRSLVRAPHVGAVVGFAGTVRDHDGGRQVRRLEYTCHPDAQHELEVIAAEAAARPGVEAVAVAHRLGRLAIGDDALVCAVAAAHRAEAFAVCAWLVDEVKARLPVWKLQVFADGSREWVNCA